MEVNIVKHTAKYYPDEDGFFVVISHNGHILLKSDKWCSLSGAENVKELVEKWKRPKWEITVSPDPAKGRDV